MTTRYVLSKLKQLDDATKTDKQFSCCMAFIKILIGIAEIPSKDDPASEKKEENI